MYLWYSSGGRFYVGLFPYNKYLARKLMGHFAVCGLMPKPENKSK